MSKFKFKIQDFGALIALLILILGISIFSPEFREFSNFLLLLRQASINGLIAFGMTAVILTGAIDLSVGSVLALSTVISAMLIQNGVPVPVSFILSLLFGAGLGLISGLFVTKGRLQAFIATLVTMTIYRGVTLLITNGRPISNLGDSFLLKFVGKGNLYGIPIPVIILLVVFAIFYLLFNKTPFGRSLYATGSNINCAKLSGINTSKVKIIAYIISGVMSALAGIILLSRLGSAQPTLGTGYELNAIAAVALGGTSMTGGRGRIYGTLIGVLIIAVLNNGLNILGVSSYWQDIVRGIVILIAVLSDSKR